MTKDEITCMAREADASFETAESMFKFAALVAAAERETCAKVCDGYGMKGSAAVDCAAAIRARGNT